MIYAVYITVMETYWNVLFTLPDFLITCIQTLQIWWKINKV